MIQTETINLPAPDIKEILRYAGVKEADENLFSVIEECLTLISDKGKICYLQINVSLEDDKIIFPFGEAESKDLARSLTGCKEAIIFACTLGTEFDNILRKYSHTDMSKAVIMQAIGTERIEALCDTFMDRFGETTRRFSPGYGDLSLEFQRDIIGFLDCFRKIGLSLGDSLIMSPSKSVTAIFGLGKKECNTENCRLCGMENCSYRKD